MHFKQCLRNRGVGVLALVRIHTSINCHEHGAELQIDHWRAERITLILALTFMTLLVCFCWGLATEEIKTTLGRPVSKAASGFARKFCAGTLNRQCFLGFEI